MEARDFWWLISDVIGISLCVISMIVLAVYAVEKLAKRIFGDGP